MSEKRTCELTGQKFIVSDAEIALREMFGVPLPRLHPDVRLKRRFPTGELYNLHDAQCANCEITIQTSMRNDDVVLCESCYQKAVY